MTEKFRRSGWGWIRSSEGFRVRLLGRTNLEYRDTDHHLRLSAEAMSKPWNDVVVYCSSIPDTAELPRTEVIERLRRAFTARGWNLLLDEQG